MPNEEWKDIPEFNGAYQINRIGQLKSVSRIVKHPTGFCRLSEKLLSQVVNKAGYIEYQITYNGKHYSRKAHRLVAEAFIPNPENKPHINHINGIKTDNRVENLEWCTPKENVAHSCDTGLQPSHQIIQKDLDGNVLKIWSRVGKIEEELHFASEHINEACAGKYRKTYKGYIWEYLEDK